MVLVLTGGEAQSEDRVRAQIAGTGLRGRVRRTGLIPRNDMLAIVRGAVALTFPSRYEGFGLPVLEAMSLGTPVLAGDAAALPEVVGDGGRLIDPDDADAWGEAMLRAAARRRRARTPGRGRSPTGGAFSWATTARDTLAAYRDAVAGDDAGDENRGGRHREGARHLPPLRARHGADRRGHDPHRRRARRSRARAARRDVAALVPAPPGRAGLDRAAGPPRGHRRRAHHTGPPVPDRQAQHPRPGPGFRRVHRAGRRHGARGRAASPPRRRAGHVATADARRRRLAGRPTLARAVRLQHPGRVPRRGGRAGCHHQPVGDPVRIAGSSAGPTGGPTPSPCCPTTCATTSSPSSRDRCPTPTTASG